MSKQSKDEAFLLISKLKAEITSVQGAIIDKHGVFFAFSDKQFSRQAKEGVRYTNTGYGICPKENVRAYTDDLSRAHNEHHNKMLEQVEHDYIILSELEDTEAFYMGEYDDYLEERLLDNYGFTSEQIAKVFCKYSGLAA